ncbi:MAG TPA: TonB-dependent receptor [Sphingobacteriaceae bacterium]|nr:TonB-dependent receptor [Sphingobacteriaceae bacterium]
MKKALLMLFLGVFLLSINAVAQEKTVTGRVTDKDGLTLPGVSVKIKGTNSGVSTGPNGNYSIRANSGQVLVFSFIGSTSQEITVGSDNTISVSLAFDTKALNEVVVVGYGTQKKATLTGAITTVNIEEVIGSRPTTDVARALQGAVPGLTITSSSGALGSNPSIRLRSMAGSLNGGGANPLILLDNVEITDLQIINPDDIESISVLKDAASASIYGTRAAWGVVLITTKSGKKGAPTRVNYSNNLSWNTPTTTPVMAPAAEGAEMALQAFRRTNPTLPRYGVVGMYVDDIAVQKMREWKQQYGGQDLGPEMVLGRDFEIRDGFFFAYREWDPGKEFMNKWTPQQKHDLSFSGGSDKINYNLGAGYLGQTGVLKVNPDEFNRYNVTLSLNSDITNWFSARGRMMNSSTLTTEPYSFGGDTYDPLYYLYRWPAQFPYGTYQGVPFRNSNMETEQAKMTEDRSNFSRLSLGGTFKLIPGLTVDADFTHGATNQHIEQTGGSARGIDFWSTGAKLETRTFTGEAHDRVVNYSDWNKSNNGRIVGTFNKNFNSHALKFVLGGEAETYEYNSQNSERRGLIDPNKGELRLATGDQFVTGSHNQSSTNGVFGRINYTFKDKYLFEVTGRYDGSSRFPANDRYAFFPSVSAGYVISEESFMDFAKPVLSTLKFRGSLGEVGHQEVGNAFLSLMGTTNSNWLIGTQNKVTVTTPSVISPSLTWETVTDLNLGVDARFLNQKLGLTFDWYRRTTSDMISAGVTLPNTFGASAPARNYGELQTKGWELALDFGHKFANGLGLNISGSLNDFNEKLTKFANTTRAIGSNYEGKTLGEIWGYETDRFFTNDDFVQDASGNPIETSPGSRRYTLKPGIPDQKQFETTTFFFGPGDVKYKDLNGDGIITRGANSVDDPGDRRIIGNTTPRYQYGLRLGSDWKGFDLGVYFQGVGSREMWVHSPNTVPGVGVGEGWYANQLDYWTPQNPNAFYPRPSNVGQAADVTNFKVQTKYLLDLSYLRAKNLSFGYTLPSRISERIKLNKARLYFSGENLFEKDKLNGLSIDPEVNYTSAGSRDQRSFGRVYPFRRSYSFGLQVTL